MGNGPIKDSRKILIKNSNKTDEKEFKLEVEFSPTSVGVQDAVKNGVKLNVQDSIKVAPVHQGKLALKLSFQKTPNLVDMRDIFIFQIKMKKVYQVPFAVKFTEKELNL